MSERRPVVVHGLLAAREAVDSASAHVAAGEVVEALTAAEMARVRLAHVVRALADQVRGAA